jgi:hypothetical protein
MVDLRARPDHTRYNCLAYRQLSVGENSAGKPRGDLAGVDFDVLFSSAEYFMKALMETGHEIHVFVPWADPVGISGRQTNCCTEKQLRITPFTQLTSGFPGVFLHKKASQPGY